jgi:hypothetical protein
MQIKLLGSLVVACVGVIAFEVWENLTFSFQNPFVLRQMYADVPPKTSTRISARRHDDSPLVATPPTTPPTTPPISISCTDTPRHRDLEAIRTLIQDDQMKFCEKNNFVHADHILPVFRMKNNTRPYSITPLSFQRHHDRYCENSSELLKAIELGTRSWGLVSSITDNMTIEEKESIPSYFVPHGCDIPYLNTREYCAAANVFTDIVIQGDSLSRHLHQAMLIAYRGDMIRGSIEPHFPNASHLHRCYCDAQFSQSQLCRPNDEGIFVNFQPHQIHACSELPYDDQFTQHFSVNRFEGNLSFSYEGVNCSSPDYKGMLLFIQGGVHWKWRVVPFWRDIWKKVIYNPVVKDCAKQKKLTLIRSGYTAQSPVLDVLFPRQSMKEGRTFDRKMDKLFIREKISVPTLRWIPLTFGAQKSDGLHFLTDVNLQEAQHVMILANMLKREGKYQSIAGFEYDKIIE